MDLNDAAMPVPAGATQNLENPPNRNYVAVVVIVLTTVISTICLAIRGYARVFLLKRFQVEEAMIVASYGLFWGAIGSLIALLIEPGFFIHQWNLRYKDLIPMTYWIFIFGIMYTLVLAFLKIAILLEWVRMFTTRGNRLDSVFFWGCVAVMAVQGISGVGVLIAMNLQCTPHAAIWDFTIVPSSCFDLYYIQVYSASMHLASDAVMLFLPQHIIWTLKMSWRKRLGVSVVFGLGLVACICAIFRMYSTVAFGHSTDASYFMGPLGFWSTAEMTCGFFIACLPCIPKTLKETGMLRTIKRKLGMSTGVTGATGGYRSGYGGSSGNGKLEYYAKGSVPSRNGLASANAEPYYMLDEESNGGVQLKSMASATMRATESTEHLQAGVGDHGDGVIGVAVAADPARGPGSTKRKTNGGGSGDASGIVRTTQITVDTSSNDDDDAHHGGRVAMPHRTPRSWAR